MPDDDFVPPAMVAEGTPEYARALGLGGMIPLHKPPAGEVFNLASAAAKPPVESAAEARAGTAGPETPGTADSLLFGWRVTCLLEDLEREVAAQEDLYTRGESPAPNAEHTTAVTNLLRQVRGALETARTLEQHNG